MGLETWRSAKAIVHVSTVDAVFRGPQGEPVVLLFHPRCGPAFERDGEDITHTLDEDDDLWRQFNGWWAAKGKNLYPPPPPPEVGKEVLVFDIEKGTLETRLWTEGDVRHGE